MKILKYIGIIIVVILAVAWVGGMIIGEPESPEVIFDAKSMDRTYAESTFGGIDSVAVYDGMMCDDYPGNCEKLFYENGAWAIWNSATLISLVWEVQDTIPWNDQIVQRFGLSQREPDHKRPGLKHYYGIGDLELLLSADDDKIKLRMVRMGPDRTKK